MFRAFMSACVMSGLLAIAICSPVNGNCDGQELKEEKLKLKLVKALKRYQDSCLDKRIIGEKELNGTRDGSFVLAKGSNGLAAYRVASRHFADDLNRADGVIEIVVRENFIVKNNKLRMVSSGGLSESNRLEAVFLPSDHNFVGHLGDIAIALGVSPVDSLSFTELVESSKAVVKKIKKSAILELTNARLGTYRFQFDLHDNRFELASFSSTKAAWQYVNHGTGRKKISDLKVTENEPYKNMIYKAVISEGMDTICREWTVSTSITGTNGTVLDYSNKYNITDANEMEKNSLETFSLEDVDRRIPVKVKVLGQKNVRFLLDNGVIRASR